MAYSSSDQSGLFSVNHCVQSVRWKEDKCNIFWMNDKDLNYLTVFIILHKDELCVGLENSWLSYIIN